MRKKLLHLTIIASILFLGACSNEENFNENDNRVLPEGTISIKVTMPGGDNPTTRVALTQDEDKAISLTWEDGDQLQLAFVKGDIKKKETVTVKNLSTDKKTAEFDIQVPSEISGKFDFYGVYGGQGIDITGGEPVAKLPSNPSLAKSLASVQARKDVMFYFANKEMEISSSQVAVDFKHIGSLFSITLKNTGNMAIEDLGRIGFFGVGGDGKWAYPFNPSGSFDLVTGQLNITGEAVNYIIFEAENSTLAGGDSITFWGWNPPLPGVVWPKLELKMARKGGGQIAVSNTLPARTQALATGMVYYVNAEWDGTQLQFIDNSSTTSNDSINQFSVRALWVDPPGFANREAVDLMIEKCQRAGINTILTNMMLRGNIYFKSTNFIGKVNANGQFDPLAYIIYKAHLVNIKVHAWSCVYLSKPKKPEWISKYFMDTNISDVFLSPGHPEVNPYILSVIKDLLKYDVDGLHIDYARYCNAAFDYSDVACNRFKESYGFNPQDFMDHSDRIVSPEKENYPIRMFCPNTITVRNWEMAFIERTMNRTGLGYGNISESAEQIDNLRAPGMLIVSHYSAITTEIVDALERYTKRGGDIVWLNPGGGMFKTFPTLGTIAGVNGTNSWRFGHESINPVKDSQFGNLFSSLELEIGANNITLGDANVVATFGNGEPSITIKKKYQGHFTTIGFHLMNCEESAAIELLKSIILWHKEKAGISGPDLMAEKRKQWIDWRANQILELVREMKTMVKGKSPKLKFSAAAGVEPEETDIIYRSGAQWLKDDLCDYLFPMNYRDNMEDFKELIENQLSLTPADKADRVFPGLQIYKNNESGVGPTDANIVKQQLDMIKGYGYQGFCLFAYSYLSDDIIKVVRTFGDDADK